jgi:hypothetical protein
MAGTITRETKREGQRKAKKQTAHENQKKGKIVLVVVGSYLTHGHSNVTYTQIMKSNGNGRSRTNITHQRNLPLYSRS